jgi:intein/homing endonuclease
MQGDVRRAIEDAVKNTDAGKAGEKVGKDLSTGVEKATDLAPVERKVEKSADKIGRAAKKAGEQAGKSVSEATEKATDLAPVERKIEQSGQRAAEKLSKNWLAASGDVISTTRTAYDEISAIYDRLGQGVPMQEWPQVFRDVEAAATPAWEALAAMGPHLSSARDRVGEFGRTYGTAVDALKSGNPGMTTTAANLRILSGGAKTLATGGLEFLKGAAGGVIGALGGPFTAALTGGAMAFEHIASQNAQADAGMRAFAESTKLVETAQLNLRAAFLDSGGQETGQTAQATLGKVAALQESLKAEGADRSTFGDIFRSGDGGGVWDQIGNVLGGGGRQDSLAAKKDEQSALANNAAAALDKLGMTQESLSAQINGDLPTFDALVARLQQEGDGGQYAAKKLTAVRAEVAGARDAAVLAGPALAKLGPDAEASADRIKTAFAAVPKDLPIKVDAPGGDAVFQLLTDLGEKVHKDNDKNIRVDAPLAQSTLDLLKALGIEVKTNNDKLVNVSDGGTIGTLKSGFAELLKTETKTINIVQGTVTGGIGSTLPRQADGGIVDAMANGGLRSIRKPSTADIYTGRGAGTIFAEEETGGEAYIPLAPAKRPRSLQILMEVARRFGVMADGGITVDALKQFASGISGGSYSWGAGNGDTLTGTDCCLVAETMVWGPNGPVRIVDLRPGDRVFSFEDGKLTSNAVNAQWFSKRQDTLEVRTRRRAITGSANHPFLRLVMVEQWRSVPGGRRGEAIPARYDVEWARLDELRRGDLLIQPKESRTDFVSNTLPSGRQISLNEAWLLGLVLGDGSVGEKHISLCVFGSIRERATPVLEAMANSAGRLRVQRRASWTDSDGIRIGCADLARELAASGFRKLAHEKSIPDCVWGWDADRQRAFLNGYCDADGHHPDDPIRHSERTYASSSRHLIDDVRVMHISLGDPVTNVTVNERRKPIVINGKRVRNARTLYVFSVSARHDSNGGVSQQIIRRGIREWIDNGDFTLAPVIKVTARGEQDTFDIEVDGAHNFIADGVVVHNSGAQSTIANFITGASGRFATGGQAAALLARGFQQGDPPAGTAAYWIGWRNGGQGGGHTAGTIVDPDGGNVNVEMGGRSGGGAFGGGADGASSFPNRAWIALASGDDPNSASGGGAAVQSAQAKVTSSKAAVTSAQAKVDQAQAAVDEATTSGDEKKQAAAQKKLDAAHQSLTAAQEKQAAAEMKLTELKEKDATNTEKTAGQDASSFGQTLVSGMLQAVGLDGSVFSNPLEWPNVKSGMALANWAGNKFLKPTQSPDGLTQPTGAQLTTPIGDAEHGGTGALPGPESVTNFNYNGPIGVDATQMQQKAATRTNELNNRFLSAVRPQ